MRVTLIHATIAYRSLQLYRFNGDDQLLDVEPGTTIKEIKDIILERTRYVTVGWMGKRNDDAGFGWLTRSGKHSVRHPKNRNKRRRAWG